MLRSALVALDGSPYSDAAAALAIDEAQRHGARLLGLGVVDAPTITKAEPVPLGGAADKHARDEALLADAHRRVLQLLVEFRVRGTNAGVAVEIAEDVGDPAVRAPISPTKDDIEPRSPRLETSLMCSERFLRVPFAGAG